jgi:hypothetical protein
LGGEDTEVGPPPEDVAGLAQHHPGAGGVVHGQADPAQLHQGLDRQVGQGVGEQGPQPSGQRQLLVGACQVALVYGHPGGHAMDQGAGHIAVQSSGPNHSLGLLGQGGGLVPALPVHGHHRALGQGDRGRGQRTGLGGDLDGVGQDGVGLVGLPGQQIADPLQQLSRGPPLTARAELGQSGLGVGPHPVHAIAAQQRPQQRQEALTGAAIRQRPGSRPVFGRIRPAFGRHRLTDQGLQPGPEHGHRPVASQQPLVLEPAKPAAGGIHPPGAVGGQGQPPDQPGDPIGVPGGLGMVDRRLRQPVGLAPGGRPGVQHWDQLGLTPAQLGGEQLLEQMVVAIPAALAIQGDQQQVGLLQPGQDLSGSGGVQDPIARRPAHPLQHRRAGQERHPLRWQLAQQL